MKFSSIGVRLFVSFGIYKLLIQSNGPAIMAYLEKHLPSLCKLLFWSNFLFYIFYFYFYQKKIILVKGVYITAKQIPHP